MVLIDVAFAIVLAALLVAGATWLGLRNVALAGRRFRRVIVALKDGTSFAGVIEAVDRQALVLRNAEAIGVGDNKTNLAVDGEVIVLLVDVAYLQRP